MGGTTGDTAADNRTSLSDLFHADVPCVAAPFTDEQTDDDIHSAIADGLDIAELRIDLFADHDPDHVVATAQRFASLPTIATIRADAEGGKWVGDDSDRLALFQRVAPLVNALDIELSSEAIAGSVVACAHEHGGVAIASFHDFAGMPPLHELHERASAAQVLGADVCKIAVAINSPNDLHTLASFTLGHSDQSLIVIGMGPLGVASRLFFPFLGSSLTFASVGDSTAPGQLTLAETVQTLARCSPAFAARCNVG